MAYHSVFNDAKVWKPPTLVHLCGFPLLPLRRVSQTRSAALFGGRKPLLVPDLSLEKDVVDEAIQAFRLNVHFRTFDMRGEGDRVLVYLLLWVQECVAANNKRTAVKVSSGPTGAARGKSERNIANPPGKGARGAATTSMGNAVDELPGPGPGPRGNSALASNIFIQKNKAQESEAAARSSQIAALLGIYAPEREEDRELETKMLNVYLRQLREEVVARLLPDFFVEDPASRDESGGSAGGVGNYTSTALRKNKWWTQYAKKKFVGLPSLV
eukprot:g4956.t1